MSQPKELLKTYLNLAHKNIDKSRERDIPSLIMVDSQEFVDIITHLIKQSEKYADKYAAAYKDVEELMASHVNSSFKALFIEDVVQILGENHSKMLLKLAFRELE